MNFKSRNILKHFLDSDFRQNDVLSLFRRAGGMTRNQNLDIIA